MIRSFFGVAENSIDICIRQDDRIRLALDLGSECVDPFER